MSDQTLSLEGSYTPASHEDWLAAVDKVLKGKPFDRLRTSSSDGIVIEPLYTPADGEPTTEWPAAGDGRRGLGVAGHTTGWDVRQAHAVDPSAPGAVNAAVLADLARGVTSIELAIGEAGIDADGLDAALHEVLLDLAPVGLRSADDGVTAARALLALADRRGVPASELAAQLGCDPIGRLVDRGGCGRPVADAIAAVAELAVEVSADRPGIRTVRVDGVPYASGGASVATELAAIASTGVAWLRALTDAGLDARAAAGQLQLVTTVDTDQFTGIAKLRALRVVWSRILRACDAGDAPVHVQATMSPVVVTARDPWVNMLRGTLACFASAVGGADTIVLAPFDAANGAPDELGLRIARNTQLILLEESNLRRVIDPAGGSWYVESLTDALAETAWAAFREIEAEGGIVASLRSGSLQARIDDTWTGIAASVARRHTPLTGVSEFPDLDATPLARAAAVAPPGPVADPEVRPLPARRLADGFERLRDAADASGNPPVFLANLGPVAVHTGRSTWSTNLLAAGGLRALGNDGFAADDALAAAFAASGARVAVICSSDAVYAERATSAAAALRGAGASVVAMAGDPGERRDEFSAAGIDEFVHVGVDVLAALGRIHAALGIPATGSTGGAS